jgi:hypothetical protein
MRAAARGEMAGDIQDIEARYRKVRAQLPEVLRLRLHRALSWCKRAGQEADDPDACFIFYWIAFNAAYANDVADAEADQASERSRFKDYFGKIVRLDQQRAIYNAIWQRFTRSIRVLLDNRYVYQPFWKFHNGVPGYDNWEELFTCSRQHVQEALARQNTQVILSVLFDRLYVLRNQLIHGGATWNSSVNRAQVKDGARILEFLLPLFIEIMMENPGENWGNPHYPVVQD